MRSCTHSQPLTATLFVLARYAPSSRPRMGTWIVILAHPPSLHVLTVTELERLTALAQNSPTARSDYTSCSTQIPLPQLDIPNEDTQLWTITRIRLSRLFEVCYCLLLFSSINPLLFEQTLSGSSRLLPSSTSISSNQEPDHLKLLNISKSAI